MVLQRGISFTRAPRGLASWRRQVAQGIATRGPLLIDKITGKPNDMAKKQDEHPAAGWIDHPLALVLVYTQL